jgi:hypothetical protein
MLVAIGSLALREVLPKLRPKDADLIAHPDLEPVIDSKLESKKKILDLKTIYVGGYEVEWARPGSSAELILNSESSKTIKTKLGEAKLANPNVLMGIMRAHLCFPIQWKKHIGRYQRLVELGIKPDENIFRLRQVETAKRMRYNPKKYLQSNESFFTDSVKRELPHDELHELFKFGRQPIYKSIKRDQISAAVEIDMFEALDFELQKRVIWEEMLVLGWERVLSKRDSDLEGLAKRFLYGMATNYLPLEFRYFVLDNYSILLKEFPYYKWDNMKSA